MRDNSRRAPTQLVGHGSTARPSHQVGGCGFEPSIIPRSTFLACGPRAHRPVENRPTTHGTRARALRGADLVFVRDNSRRAFPQPHGQISAVWSPHQVGGCGFKLPVILRLTFVAHGLRAHRPVTNRPTAHGARARAMRSASDSRGARPARSSPCGEPVDRPQNTRACTAQCGLGCGAGKLATRSSPVRWPLLDCTATASSRRLQLRTVGNTRV